MADLIDFIRSQQYLRAYTKQQTGIESGVMLVESPSDRLFWEKLISHACPGRYLVKHFSEGKAEGKRTLEAEYAHLHSDRIVGVDGDYDYLCPNRSNKALTLNSNAFILHTFCYSRESYASAYESITDIKNRLFYRNRIHDSLIETLQKYSHTIYPALCIFSFLHNSNPNIFLENDFRNAISLNNDERLLDDELNTNTTTLDELQSRIRKYTLELQSNVTDEVSFESYKQFIRGNEINEDNAYMFIDGHYLQDSIVIPMLKSIAAKAKLNDINEIKEKTTPAQQKIKINEVHNHFKDKCNIQSLIFQCHCFMKNIFWDKMTEKLKSI